MPDRYSCSGRLVTSSSEPFRSIDYTLRLTSALLLCAIPVQQANAKLSAARAQLRDFALYAKGADQLFAITNEIEPLVDELEPALREQVIELVHALARLSHARPRA